MLYPYWVQVVQFAAFVLGAWILIPAAKWGSFKLSLRVNVKQFVLGNGTKYPTTELLTPNLRLNETRYEELGPVHLGAQRAWNMFSIMLPMLVDSCGLLLLVIKACQGRSKDW